MYVTPKRLGPWPLRPKVVPLSIVAPTVMRVTRTVLETCAFIPLAGLMAH
jgi:hypothetical protein